MNDNMLNDLNLSKLNNKDLTLLLKILTEMQKEKSVSEEIEVIWWIY